MAWADVCIFIADQIDAKLKAGSAPEVVGGASHMSWTSAAVRMERLRSQGEPFISQSDLAKQFECSSGTIHKAIKRTPALQTWAKRNAAAPKAQSLNDVVADRTAQSSELDPPDDAAMREWLEQADDEGRAWFHSLSPEDQRDVVRDPDKYPRILGRTP